MSQTQDESPTTPKTSPSRQSSPLEFERRASQLQAGTEPSSPLTQPRDSSSEGYPSWLPKRPPPPHPRSTIHSASVVGMFNEPGPSAGSDHFPVGRKATPRSVRVVSLQNSAHLEKEHYGRRTSTDPSRAFSGAQTRVWSRAASSGLSPTLLSSGIFPPLVRPRLRSPSLHPELLRSPSWKMRLWFYLFPVFAFSHLALQTFFDFNAVFILLLVAKYPNPAAPGVPGSGRNWALAAAAYIACWVTQVFVVFVVYELLYSFVRRWRVKRPLILPLYLSSPAYNLTAMTSYTNFCFMYHIRASAFSGEKGSLRDGLAETFYYYSQNVPTVGLLLPRAALSLALLLAFWSPQAGELALADSGTSPRDGTYFRSSNQTLTDYARGVLIANAAWTAWRILVLFISWVGLWALSGHGCAGLCGPRYRWEEDDAEKTIAAFSDNFSDTDALAWTWREGTTLRVMDAYEFCLTNKAPRASLLPGEKDGVTPSGSKAGTGQREGMDKVMAAIGLGGGVHPARRGVLSDDLFESPGPESETEALPFERVSPPSPAVHPKEKRSTGPSTPLKTLPYPFTGSRAQVSSAEGSAEAIPFPPSPEPTDEREANTTYEGEDDSKDLEDDVDPEGEEGLEEGDSEEPSDGRRTSGSMSSLGRPIASRYPYDLRGHRGRGSMSSTSQRSPRPMSTPRSAQTSSTPSRFTQSPSTHLSHSTRSGNGESTDSPYPRSSNAPSPSSVSGSGIPMPPRHPHRRTRAGTVPAPSVASSPSPPVGAMRARARTRAESARPRTESAATATDAEMTFGPGALPLHFEYHADEDRTQEGSLMDVPEAEGSVEEAEQQDSVGLLSGDPSPRASRTSLTGLRRISGGRSNGSRSHSGTGTGTGSRSASRSRSISTASHSESARSRAQSFIHSIGAASRSSIDLVRSRANSLVRLSDSPYYSSSPDPVPSSPENYTFGHPLRAELREAPPGADVVDLSEPPQVHPRAAPRSRSTSRNVPAIPEETGSPTVTLRQRLISDADAALSEPQGEGAGGVPAHPAGDASAPIPIPGRAVRAVESMADISTAHQSLVTAPATVQGTTDSSGRTPSSWDAVRRHPPEHGDTFEPA